MNTHTVYYDDQCDVCRKSMARLKWLDSNQRIKATPLSQANLPRGITMDDARRKLHVVAPDGTIYRGWRAVAKLMRLFPLTWPFGVVGALPPVSWFGRAAYRAFARRRYVFNRLRPRDCRTGTCRHCT